MFLCVSHIDTLHPYLSHNAGRILTVHNQSPPWSVPHTVILDRKDLIV